MSLDPIRELEADLVDLEALVGLAKREFSKKVLREECQRKKAHIEVVRSQLTPISENIR